MKMFWAKADWINFCQSFFDENKRASLVLRIQKHGYMKLSQMISMYTGGYALHPLELNLEISDQCNLKCRMCPTRVLHQEHLTQSDPNRVVKAMEMLKVKTLRFSGLGEPMMADTFWPLVDTANNMGCKIAMVTNGTLLDDESIQKICDTFSMITISLDSATSETYQSIRCVDAFDHLYDAIRKIYTQRRKNNLPSPLIAINWVVMKSNYLELLILVRNLRRDGIKIDLIHCDPLIPHSADMSEEIIHPDMEGLSEYFDYVREEALAAKIYFEYPYFQRYDNEKALTGNMGVPVSCRVLWESLFLSLNSEFLPCCEYYLNTVGNISGTNPYNAWNSKIMRDARTRSLKGVAPFPYCNNCHKYAGKGDPKKMLERIHTY